MKRPAHRRLHQFSVHAHLDAACRAIAPSRRLHEPLEKFEKTSSLPFLPSRALWSGSSTPKRYPGSESPAASRWQERGCYWGRASREMPPVWASGDSGHMYRHLVAVEIGIESSANQRMNSDRLSFHQHGLKGLNAQSVQRRGPVQQDGMFFDDSPRTTSHTSGLPLLHHLLRALDGCHLFAILHKR